MTTRVKAAINKHPLKTPTELVISYGMRQIQVNVLWANRKTLEIAVLPNMTVVAKAPIDANISLVEKKLSKKAKWILKQINFFKQFNPQTPKRNYVIGETHLYLGKQYRLKFIKDKAVSVKLTKGFFVIRCPETAEPKTAEKLLNDWYFEKASLQFKESIDRCWSKFKKFGIIKPKLSVKKMKKRWGSLSAAGTITLNTFLIRAPKECIDYVVFHELCHLVHKQHCKEFYDLLYSMNPNWEKTKHKLEIKTT